MKTVVELYKWVKFDSSIIWFQFSSVTQSCLTLCNLMDRKAWWASLQFSLVTHSWLTLQPHGQQHARLPCPSPTPRACSNSCPLSRWCHPTISSSVIPFSFCLQSFQVSGSFPMSWLIESGGQSTGTSASASVLPVNTQAWCLSWLTGLISLPSKGLS